MGAAARGATVYSRVNHQRQESPAALQAAAGVLEPESNGKTDELCTQERKYRCLSTKRRGCFGCRRGRHGSRRRRNDPEPNVHKHSRAYTGVLVCVSEWVNEKPPGGGRGGCCFRLAESRFKLGFKM